MSDNNKELEELEAAGVEFLDQTDPLSTDDFQKRLDERTVRVSSDEDKEPPLISAEDLRARAEEQEAEAEKHEQRRELRRQQDREIRAERWEKEQPNEWARADLAGLPSGLREACQRWLDKPDDEKWAAVLYGPTGTGKTFSMYCMIRELWIDRYDYEVVEVPVMMDMLRPNAEEATSMLNRFRDVEVLCLDDIGSERMTEWTGERMDMLINYRWQRKKPTIVTTNIAPVDLKDLIGPRAASRLLGESNIIHVTGKDRRIR